ncbi:hypothetical protein KPL35_15275 [Clostridium sp. CF011]|uniref:hypothetical protein n=1 Tax=Clostridium sp. CF011 TaxID=2843318 RepID=UPI001C0DD30F|nr:hypothetical protein [Clostridium sp. CF011]MBU3093424.1 hypothetical protein [Clostridium sp. CF011]WAG71269.1 hypothetical protein LL036_07650 [Clostridium sp. CF011]
MKLLINCFVCLQKTGVPNMEFMEVEICDDGIYKATCDCGHETVTFLQQDKVEVLFEMGAMALLDGYPREAVSSFAASLERFYELCIKVFLLKRGANMDNVDKTWKLVSNQSERQLGAYYFLYLDILGNIPLCLDNKQVEFRNKVIHKGYIPKYDEVLKYANYLLNYMLQILIDLKLECNDEIIQVTSGRFSNMRKGFIKDGKITRQIATMSIPTIVNLFDSNINYTNKDFTELLESKKEYYAKFYRR